MSSYLNKLVNTVTNQTSSIIGRENLTKMSNSINRTFKKSKYRNFLKAGNIVQIISKNSHMSLQICSSQNDTTRLILMGNGQIGPEYSHSSFTLETEPKHNHLKFKNGLNYIAFDQDVPCVLSEPTNPKHKSELIRARNEFRLHEIIGSEEYFALESVYFPGKYLSILPNGSIAVTKNKAEINAHFCLNVLYDFQRPQSVQDENQRPQSVYIPAVLQAEGGSNNSLASSNSIESRQKEEESRQTESIQSQTSYEQTRNRDSTPPPYASLFPKLPQ